MDALKRILYVSPNGYLGGAEKFVVNTVSLHQALNHEEIYSLFFSAGASVDVLREKGLRPEVLKTKFRLSTPFQLLKALREIRSFVKKNQIDIIHSTMAYGHLVMTLATLGLNVKRVWFQHGPVSGKLDLMASLVPVDAIFFNSQYLEEEHFRSNPDLYKAPRFIIPLGIEKLSLQHLPSAKTEVLLAGRMSKGKGFHLILDSIKKWKEDRQDWIHSFHFTIVGGANSAEDKAYLKSLETQAEELGDLVTFKPFTKDMSPLYAASQILIQPSLVGEGFGLVLAEAMAAGLLVIGPSYGGSSEILRQGVSGFTIDFRSPDLSQELARILSNYQKDSDQFRIIIQTGKNLIEDHYSPEVMMKSLERSYAGL